MTYGQGFNGQADLSSKPRSTPSKIKRRKPKGPCPQGSVTLCSASLTVQLIFEGGAHHGEVYLPLEFLVAAVLPEGKTEREAVDWKTAESLP